MAWCQRNASAVKSTACSSRGPRFNSQHSHGTHIHLKLTGDLMSSFASVGTAHTWYERMNVDKTAIKIKIK